MEAFTVFCREFQELLAREQEVLTILERGRKMLSALTGEVGWYQKFLRRMLLEPDFLARQKPGVWSNQVVLYRSPDGSFGVLSYTWDAHATDVIHDHASWGIISTVVGRIGERKYKRLDNNGMDGFADLKEVAFRTLGPGDTTSVLPLDQGIHRMENDTDAVGVTINVYGKGSGRGYSRIFDAERRTVTRAYPPHTAREMLAIKALGDMGGEQAEEILKEAAAGSLPEALKKECSMCLERLQRPGAGDKP